MTDPLFCDSSALLHRYLAGPHTAFVNDRLATTPSWIAAAVTRTEVSLALHRTAQAAEQLDRLWASFRADWAAMHVVPVDDRCLARAVDLGATYGLTTVEAIQLAAADRLPRPTTLLTLAPRQLPAAIALDLTVATRHGATRS